MYSEQEMEFGGPDQFDKRCVPALERLYICRLQGYEENLAAPNTFLTIYTMFVVFLVPAHVSISSLKA